MAHRHTLNSTQLLVFLGVFEFATIIGNSAKLCISSVDSLDQLLIITSDLIKEPMVQGIGSSDSLMRQVLEHLVQQVQQVLMVIEVHELLSKIFLLPLHDREVSEKFWVEGHAP